MKPLPRNTQNSLEAGSSRPTVEFNLPSEETIGCGASDNRWDWPRIQQLLEGLAKYGVSSGALPKNPRFDLTTGKTAGIYETLGMFAFSAPYIFGGNILTKAG